MTRTFIQTHEFVANWANMGLGDKDLRRLELELLKNPKTGKVIRGTGGLRKLRFAFENRGKSGSVRVCYVVLYSGKRFIWSRHIRKMKRMISAGRNVVRSVR